MICDNRLLKCASLVSGKGIVCDVGTDHAYLPVYLLENGICTKAIAGDIADGPLEAASATVKKAGLEDKIDVVKSDGLKNISPEGITDVVMAGMGAETISEIIAAAPWLENSVNLVLQPMTKEPYLRKWLYENGYSIVKEEAVSDGDRIYTVINAVFDGFRMTVSDTFAETGMFDLSNEESLKYIKTGIRVANLINFS